MKIKKIIVNTYICAYLLLSKSVVAYAAAPTPLPTDVTDQKVVTGTQALVTWAMNIEMVLSGVITGFFVVKEIIKIQAAPEEADTKPYYKHIRTIVIAGVAAILAGGIIKKIFEFYR